MSTVTSAITSTPTPIASNVRQLGFTGGLEGMPPEFLRYRHEMQESVRELATPLNLSLVLILLTFLYLRFRPTDPLTLDPQTPITFRTFTPRTLVYHNGHPSKPHNPEGSVYLAVRGKVYDVTSGRNFYGPGGPYENFAGRDATRGLACQSFDEDMLTKNLDGPLDDCTDLNADELENLKGWIERFDEKYLVVGRLIAFNDLRRVNDFRQ